MKFQKTVLHLCISFFGLISVVSCSDVRLSKMPGLKVNVTSTGDFCTLSPENIKRYTKFMFVMDKSGSNGQTDPGAVKRATGIEDFYNANKDKDAIQWGMITFTDPGTKAVIGGPQDPIFVPGLPEDPMRNALAELRSSDGGGTPYGAALALTQKGIEKDLKSHPDEDNLYMVFFVSDGEPTDGASDDATLRGLVQNIINLSPGHVYLSTGYYNVGGGSGSATNRLKMMAQVGMGKFFDFTNSDKINFDNLIVGGPSKEPWQIKNFVVSNLNSTICEDGTVDVDSDGDGLCDKDEVKYGLNPRKRFSKPGGFGDYFQWRSIKFGEKLPACEDRTDEDHDLLTTCEEAYIFNQTPISPSPDINIPMHGDAKNPDTDLDGFIDGIEIFSFRDKSSPMNARDVLTNFDGEGDAGTQIKGHKNPQLWDPNTFEYDSRLTPREVRTDTGQTCYNFTQSKLLLYDTLEVTAEDNFPEFVHKPAENIVFAYYIQTMAREPLAKGIYMYSFQKLKRPTSQGASNSFGDAAGLKIHDGMFKAYVVPKQ